MIGGVDPDIIVSSPFGTLVLALAIITGFITGTIVSGKSYGELLAAIKALTEAIEMKNKMDQEALFRRERS